MNKDEFYEAVKQFKEYYARETDQNSSYIEIHVNDSNNIIVVPTSEYGDYMNDVWRF